MRVLLADDNDDLRILIKRRLEMDGWDVVAAVDGREALYCYHESIHQGKYFELVILDIAMPRLNGFAVGINIRNLEKFGDVPRAVHVYLSGQADIVPPQELIDTLFADAYFRKPFDPEKLLADVNRLVEENKGEARATARK